MLTINKRPSRLKRSMFGLGAFSIGFSMIGLIATSAHPNYPTIYDAALIAKPVPVTGQETTQDGTSQPAIPQSGASTTWTTANTNNSSWQTDIAPATSSSEAVKPTDSSPVTDTVNSIVEVPETPTPVIPPTDGGVDVPIVSDVTNSLLETLSN